MNRALILSAALILTSCATPWYVPGEDPTTPQLQIYELQRQLDEAIGEIEVYAAQPECSDAVVVSCHDPEAVDLAVAAAKEADTALDSAEAVVRAGGTDVAVYVDLARTALNRIAAYLVAREAPR